MTTIAWDGRYLVADAQATIGGMRVRARKIGSLNDGRYYAYAGRQEDCEEALAWLNNPIDDRPDLEEAVLIVVNPIMKTAHFYERRLRPIQVLDSFAAEGSGMPFAMAVLNAGGTAVEAVQAAIKLDTCSGMGIDILDTLTGQLTTHRFEILPEPVAESTQEIKVGPGLARKLAQQVANNEHIDRTAVPGPWCEKLGRHAPSLKELVREFYADTLGPAGFTPKLVENYFDYIAGTTNGAHT